MTDAVQTIALPPAMLARHLKVRIGILGELVSRHTECLTVAATLEQAMAEADALLNELEGGCLVDARARGPNVIPFRRRR